ncbi:MAG: hypothetical protein JRI71_04760, partial [Deltaproteobacteria bacterium]|nr:hypothetical protein [Deltaproteobacteria bacterium]
YEIRNLTFTGEPVENSMIKLLKKTGSSSKLISRAESGNRLKGTKRIIVKAGNVFIGKGKIDNRSILIIPIMKKGPHIDHLLLLDVAFNKDVDLSKKIKALGDKFRNLATLKT